MMVMISAHSMLTLYLGLELLSLSLYAMVAFSRDDPLAAEAAMKYFVLGAIASGCFLFGISIVYGLTGSLDLGEIGRAVRTLDGLNVHLLFGLSFILVGVAFKFGAVPFHMWMPDVYQGAPTAVTLFIGTAAKMASFALLVRVLIEGLGPLHSSWGGMVTGAVHPVHGSGQCGGHRADQSQTHAGLFDDLPRRLHPAWAC